MYGPAYLILFDVKLVVILTQYSQALMDSQTGVDSDIKQKNQMIWPNMSLQADIKSELKLS